MTTKPEASFATKILAERKRCGLSRREAAALLDVSARTLENWEAGDSYPASASTIDGVLARYAKTPSKEGGKDED